MIYITGDTHGDFSRIGWFKNCFSLTPEDTMIVLGDAGLNYFCSEKDLPKKRYASSLGCTFFCIHGNHEERPYNIDTYKTMQYHGGTVWYEEAFPNILFAKDGEIYRLGNYDCIVIGGAYSVDKYYRLAYGYRWFESEQPSDNIKSFVENQLSKRQNKIDIVLSHTCPLKYEPTEVFLKGIDQSSVDKSTEKWLDKIEDNLIYKRWYCGHYHTSKTIDRLRFMFEDIDTFEI